MYVLAGDLKSHFWTNASDNLYKWQKRAWNIVDIKIERANTVLKSIDDLEQNDQNIQYIQRQYSESEFD